eukprot:Skav213799  [mRNA]  locus=scaffold1987:266417:268235:- [translate_table: standard]
MFGSRVCGTPGWIKPADPSSTTLALLYHMPSKQDHSKNLGRAEVPLDFANNDGFAPLDLCVRKQQAEVGDLLVAAGAKLVKDMRKTPPTMAIAAASGLPFFCSYMLKSPDAKKQLMAVDAEGRSPLLRAVALGHGGAGACAAGQREMLELLLRRKAAVEQLDAQGSTGAVAEGGSASGWEEWDG